MAVERSVIGALKPYLLAERRSLPFIIGLGLLSAALEGLGLYLFLPLLSLIGQSTSDAGVSPFGLDRLTRDIAPQWQIPLLLLLVVASIVIKNVVVYFNASRIAAIESRNCHRRRVALFDGLLRASLGYIESQPIGQLSHALVEETWRFGRAISALYQTIVETCAVLALVVLLFLISWQLTLMISPLFAVAALSMHVIVRRARSTGKDMSDRSANYANRTWQTLTGLRTVWIYGRADHERERHDAASENVRKIYLDARLLQKLVPTAFEAIAALFFGLAILVMQWWQVDIPTIAVFMIVLYRMQPRVNSLVSSRAELIEAGAAVEVIDTTLTALLASQPPSGNTAISGLQNAIVFRNVSAVYQTLSVPTVEELDFTIPKNTTTAIVGPSGSGKSTIATMLTRGLLPSSGSIFVDGVNLSDLRADDWHALLAAVDQDIFLFDGTIEENIRYGKLDATDEEVARAAQQAYADEFIANLPGGYASTIGVRGVRLSGGQRQRIALARALIRRPDLLIADEATNALDSHSERLIQKTLEELRATTTIVIVAHRLATVKNADQILVVDKGRIVECGNYAELMARDGSFASLFRMQMLGDDESGAV